MSLTHLRAGVIGTGFIGPVHIEALKRLGIQVVAVCDTDANAAAAAERFGIPNAIGGLQYQRLVAHPDVDVVHVASPNRLHAEHSLAALAAGKHVVCEKPLAMTSEETAKIVAAAKKSRRVFAVNYNLRFYAALQTLRAMVADGQFGRIIHVNGSYFQDWLFHETDYNWRLLPKEGGKLRALADIGTHWMDAASFILGDHVGEVFADLGIHHKTRKRPLGEVKTFSGKTEGGRWQSYKVETEDYASVLLHYGRGAHGTLVGVAGGRRAQESAAAGDLRREAIGVVGLRVARAVDLRAPRPRQPGGHSRRGGLQPRRGPSLHGLPRRPRRRVRRQLQDAVPRDLLAHRRQQVGAAVCDGRRRRRGSAPVRGDPRQPHVAKVAEGGPAEEGVAQVACDTPTTSWRR